MTSSRTVSEPIRPHPLSNWSDELLLETLPIRQHIVAELDLLIKHPKAEIYARQSDLGQEDEPSALTDRLLAVLIEARRVAAESAEEIEQELQRRKTM